MSPRVRVKRLWSTLLLNPFELPLIVCLLVVAVVFTAFPEALDHTAISFENRGAVHHLGFHYPLLFGAAFALIGLLGVPRRIAESRLGRRLTPEKIRVLYGAGLALIFVAISLNFVALLATEIEANDEPISGLTVAIRCTILIGLALKIWILATRPTAIIRVGQPDV